MHRTVLALLSWGHLLTKRLAEDRPALRPPPSLRILLPPVSLQILMVEARKQLGGLIHLFPTGCLRHQVED